VRRRSIVSLPIRFVLLALALLGLIACSNRPAPKSAASPTAASPAAESPPIPTSRLELAIREFDVPARTRPHDVAPAADGGVWYTAQGSGELGYLDPSSGQTRHVDLGDGSAPHGVIVGPDGAAWVTDSGLNAIVRVDAKTSAVKVFKVPGSDANLNTPTFDGDGKLWFTGQGGIYGRVDPSMGKVDTYQAPKGRGPYGIATAPDGTPWFSSLAGSYLARIDRTNGQLKTFDTPTPGGGARRVWLDSKGMAWITEWNAGKIARFDPSTEQWKEWALPGSAPQPYAVFVDERDIVWISDFGANTIVRFDPKTEKVQSLPLASPGGNVRQILGRRGEVWGAESGAAKLILIKTG
jgi:virginiamycin B lyase